MIRDRDRIYGTVVTRRLRAMGIRDKPIVPASPWQNGFAERIIGSIRRECVDHIVVLGEVHLRQILQSYARYYTMPPLANPPKKNCTPMSNGSLTSTACSAKNSGLVTWKRCERTEKRGDTHQAALPPRLSISRLTTGLGRMFRNHQRGA
jgi:hypothetical protein